MQSQSLTLSQSAHLDQIFAVTVQLLKHALEREAHRVENLERVRAKALAGDVSAQINLAGLTGEFHLRANKAHTIAQLRGQSDETLAARKRFIQSQRGYKFEILNIERIQRERAKLLAARQAVKVGAI